MIELPLITEFDETRLPKESSVTFRADASYVWSTIVKSVKDINTFSRAATKLTKTIDIVVAKEKLMNPHYTAIDSVDENMVIVNVVAKTIDSVKNVSESISDVNIVAENINIVDIAVKNIDDLVVVAKNITNVGITASSIADVNRVASAIDIVDITAKNIQQVKDIANSITGVNTTAKSIEDVNKIADDIDSVNLTAKNIEDVNEVANNMTVVLQASKNAKEAKQSAKEALDNKNLAMEFSNARFLGAFAREPTKDNLGKDIKKGALFFDTNIDTMKIYKIDGWKIAYASLDDLVAKEIDLVIKTHKELYDTEIFALLAI